MVRVLPVVIIAFGLFVRYWNAAEWYLFGYDQEVVFWAVKSILDGKLTLIGQEMSVGGFYLGPLLHYIYAPLFALFNMDPFTGIIPLFIQSLATMVLLFVLAKRWFGYGTGLIVTFLYAIHPQAIRYDLGFNPTAYVPLMSILYLLAMDAVLQGKKYALWFLGSVLGLTIHINPSTFFFFSITAISLLLFRRQIRTAAKDWIISGGILLLLISPLVAFEYRHGILLPNLIRLMSTQGEPFTFLDRFFSMIRVSLALSYEFFFRDVHPILSYVMFSLLSASIFLLIRKRALPHRIFLLISFFLVPILLFTIYGGHVPEYYFQPTMPIFAMLLGFLVMNVFRSPHMTVVACFLILLLHIPALSTYVVGGTHQSLPYRRAAVRNIVTHSRGNPFAVSYVTDPGYQSGYPYLFYSEGQEPTNDFTLPLYTIVDPYFMITDAKYDAIFGNSGVIYPDE